MAGAEDFWWPFEGWTGLSYVATSLGILGLIGIGIGLFLQVAATRRQSEEAAEDFQREEVSREEHAYEVITAQYVDLTRLCFDHPHLQVARTLFGEPGDVEDGDVRFSPRQERIAWEMLFEVLEKAFVLYRAYELYAVSSDPSLGPSWRAVGGKSWDGGFRTRQWAGWDSWIRRDLSSSPEFWNAWDDACSGDTYDSWFMAYMRGARLHPLTGADLRVINRGDDETWGNVDGILEASFAPHSLRPAEEIRLHCSETGDRPLHEGPIFLGAFVDGRLGGFAIYEYLHRSGFVYLWFMATQESLRGRGVGTDLLTRVEADLEALQAAGLPARGIIAEVEAPRNPSDSSDPDSKRIRFYRRNGFQIVDLVEVSPPFATDESDPLWYWLAVRGRTPEAAQEPHIARALEDIFRESTLNGAPNKDEEGYLRYSLTTLGRPPASRDRMRAEWRAHGGSKTEG